MVICVHQLRRPDVHVPVDGVGNCTLCRADPENNPRCRNFYPIRIQRIVGAPIETRQDASKTR